jgi:hypothetical protein
MGGFLNNIKDYFIEKQALDCMQTKLTERKQQISKVGWKARPALKRRIEVRDINLVMRLYNKVYPLSFSPLEWLKKISPHIRKECRIHEFFWGRGEVTIHSADQSVSFSPLSWDSSVTPQGLILGVTASNPNALLMFLKGIEHDLPFLEVKIWETQEGLRKKKDFISVLIHLYHKKYPRRPL